MTAIAIIGAMDEEVANIATALSNVTVTEEAGVKVTRGTLETNKGTAVNVAATVGGMGTVNIAATTQHLIDADQPDDVRDRHLGVLQLLSQIHGGIEAGREDDIAGQVTRNVGQHLETLRTQRLPNLVSTPINHTHSALTRPRYMPCRLAILAPTAPSACGPAAITHSCSRRSRQPTAPVPHADRRPPAQDA